jgi:hypothetical protein
MKKQLLIGILVLSLLSVPIPAAALDSQDDGNLLICTSSAYDDLPAEWYRLSVEAYGYPELFSDGSGHFYPDRTITRIEFARMLHKAIGININYFAPIDIGQFYDDVENGDAGASELYDLTTLDIIDRSGLFGPGEPLNREEMIHYIMRALHYLTSGDYAIIMIAPAPFDDDAEISADYKDDIVRAVVMQLVNGRGGNRLYPNEGATRAEAAVLVDRLVKISKDLQSDIRVSATASETAGRLKLVLSIENNGSETATIEHSSGQQYDFKLFDVQGEILYCWSADKMFISMLSTTTINAGDRVTFTEELDSAVYGAIRDRITLIKGYIVGTSDKFIINPDGYIAAKSET